MYVIWIILAVGVVCFVTQTLFVASSQSRYVYHPDCTIVETPAAVGLAFEEVTLPTEDGEQISAWYVPAKVGGEDVAPTILFCHGNAGNISGRLRSLQTFSTLGFNTLIFDYRGYGDSTGIPSEKGTYLDAMACWKYLVDERSVPPSRIVVFGRSLGGAIASHVAQAMRPGALVLESVFSSVPNMAARMFPLLPIRWFCRFSYDNESNVTNVQCPVMVAHSRSDETCPFEQGYRVYEAALEPKEFVEIEGGHNDGGLDSNPLYQVKLVDFIQEHL
jgi:uncharacterized protein